MRYIIGGLASALLVPLCYAMSGGPVPGFFSGSLFGIPVATLFVLVEMSALVGLCWVAMKVVARESMHSMSGGEAQTPVNKSRPE